jgi:arginine decarboxylase
MGEVILTVGKGEANSYLTAFDAALINAGIANFNLIKVSSIVPPNSKITILSKKNINNSTSLNSLPYGTLLPTVYTYSVSSVPGEKLVAAIGVAKIKDDLNNWGIIMEKSGVGEEELFRNEVKNMLEEALFNRNKYMGEVEIISIRHEVERIGAVVAACVIINQDLLHLKV